MYYNVSINQTKVVPYNLTKGKKYYVKIIGYSTHENARDRSSPSLASHDASSQGSSPRYLFMGWLYKQLTDS